VARDAEEHYLPQLDRTPCQSRFPDWLRCYPWCLKGAQISLSEQI
jgi:hypothetical protein